MVTAVLFFLFKQKTAYEMRISDWSSDVCSSDLKDRSGNIIKANTRIDFNYQEPHIAEPFDIIINEIMADPNPAQGLSAMEYVELKIGRASCRERVCQYV